MPTDPRDPADHVTAPTPQHPRIVLVDPDDWAAFASLAAAVRRRSVAVLRVSVRPAGGIGPLERLLDRLVFGRPGHLLATHDETPTAEVMGSLLAPPTVDVQGPEAAMAQWRRAADWPATAAAMRVPEPEAVPLLFDKHAMSSFAACHGVPVPSTWTEPPPGTFPLVVKGRLGAGGAAVEVVTDEDQLARAVAALDPSGEGTVFFEAFETGHVVTYGGVASRGRILAGAAFRTMPPPDDPLGPAERIEVVDCESISESVPRLVDALQYSGFLCVDFVVRPDGSAALIDVNPRVFGSWLALQETGVDLLSAYLSLFGCATEPPYRRAPIGAVRYVRQLPDPRLDSFRAIPGQTRHAVRALTSSVGITGFGYLVATTARSVARLVRGAFRALTGRDGALDAGS
jgi:hypothetical protein